MTISKTAIALILVAIVTVSFIEKSNTPTSYRYFLACYTMESEEKRANGEIGFSYRGFPPRGFIDSCLKASRKEWKTGFTMTLKSIFEFKSASDYNSFYSK